MRRTMKISVLSLLGLALVALAGTPAQAHKWKRGYERGDHHEAHAVVIKHGKHGKHGRHHGWKRHRHGHDRSVVVVKKYKPVTRVIVKEVRPRHRHHRRHRHDHYGDPLANLLGRILAGAVANTLETGRSGQTVVWNNPDSGTVTQVTPVRTYRTASGQYCREYTTTGTIGGYQEDLYGTACRQQDGSWLRVQ